MKWRLFNLAAAVSLALCVATVALWVGSARTAKVASYWHSGQRDSVIFWNGRLGLAHTVMLTPEEGWVFVSTATPLTNVQIDGNGFWQRLGFTANRVFSNSPPSGL